MFSSNLRANCGGAKAGADGRQLPFIARDLGGMTAAAAKPSRRRQARCAVNGAAA
jgi:hypothetical protein